MNDLQPEAPKQGSSGCVVISIDAMGGDLGPEAVIGGMTRSVSDAPDIRFIVHGPQDILQGLIDRHPELAGRCAIRHAEGVVTMDDKPSQVVRTGKDSSMWSALESVRAGEASVAVSCGNTGALMALSVIRLRRLPGINRPAIACLWPSRNSGGFNVMLDVGADVKADAEDLLQYALMGVSYARNGLGLRRPRVGLLNVGTEEHKGRAELKAANELIAAAAPDADFEHVGFVEGSDLPSDRVDVIVTDGFTGNVALKTGEGTARLVGDFLREALNSGLMARLGALLAMRALKALGARIDPRRVNGGVFLGLNGTVVKSHGASDATGVAAAIGLAYKLARSGYQERLAARVAHAAQAGQDAPADREQDGQNR